VPDFYRISSELFWDVRSVIVSFGPPRNLRISLEFGLSSRHRTLYAADNYHQDASHTATNHIADQSPDVHPASGGSNSTGLENGTADPTTLSKHFSSLRLS
jgi:hypothetical protein